jgi:hypothetical protein
MHQVKEHALRVIEARARQNVGHLASRLVRAASDDKEPILAALEFERWLAERCREAIDDVESTRRPRI